MPNRITQYSLRLDAELVEKFCYVAEYNARSANRELTQLIRNHVLRFEQKVEKIDVNKPE